ncbi:hypothetical protein P7K49_001986, partial [Saguinus oedipus]
MGRMRCDRKHPWVQALQSNGPAIEAADSVPRASTVPLPPADPEMPLPGPCDVQKYAHHSLCHRTWCYDPRMLDGMSQQDMNGSRP